jgi:hypothetical protein
VQIYLDTTYSHPKHQFQTQDAAVNEIADEAEKAIGGEKGGDCLLLLSSYKIGKEKVMLEVARRTGDSCGFRVQGSGFRAWGKGLR